MSDLPRSTWHHLTKLARPNRRAVLKGATAAGGSLLVPLCDAFAQDAHRALADYKRRFFTDIEWAFVMAACDSVGGRWSWRARSACAHLHRSRTRWRLWPSRRLVHGRPARPERGPPHSAISRHCLQHGSTATPLLQLKLGVVSRKARTLQSSTRRARMRC